MPDRDVEATPLTNARVYNITYNNVEDATMDNPESYTIETESFSLSDPQKAGYTFV